MSHETPAPVSKSPRRKFLAQVCGGFGIAAAAGSAAAGRLDAAEGAAAPGEAAAGTREGAPPEPLPTIRLGNYTVTRLITGGNPIGGFSHAVPNLSRHMVEYFTPERTVEYLEKCVRAGINTWQFDYFPKCAEALRIVRERGSELQFVCLHCDSRGPLDVAIEKMRPIAVVHHGGVTDSLFRQGKAGQVRDFVKQVHDRGLLAGVSSHSPDNIRRIADEGWEVDLFMTCFYYVTRTREEQRSAFGDSIVDEPFLEDDPIRMTAVIRQVEKPCLAFKILAAGRRCNSQAEVERAFQFAFANIKPTDAVIVGMFPKYEDEISLNVAYTRKHGRVAS